MPSSRPLTILCVSSYEKGQEFLRTAKAMGCRVLLLTVEKLKDGDWPRDVLDDLFLMPEELPVEHLINTVSYLARSQHIDRIVALLRGEMSELLAHMLLAALMEAALMIARSRPPAAAMRAGKRAVDQLLDGLMTAPSEGSTQ